MEFDQTFKWNDETKELSEITTGDQLVDSQQRPMDGRFEKTFIYPHHTAIELVKELERQKNDAVIQQDAAKKAIEEAEKKYRRIDKAFFEKFQACMEMRVNEQNKDQLKTAELQLEKLNEQLKKVKDAMGRED